jgi:hypothetical protein
MQKVLFVVLSRTFMDAKFLLYPLTSYSIFLL